MKKRNKGQISVYACAMLCVFLLLITTVLQGIRIWEGKAKARQALSGAVDSIKGDYQPDLFRRYHLFVLDKTYYGRGEGYLEERVKEYLEYNLNPEKSLYDYQIQDVMLAESVSLTEDELAGFRQQIQDYMEMKFPVQVAEELMEKLEWNELENQQNTLQEEWSSIADANTDSAMDSEPVAAEFSGITAEDIGLLGIEDLLKEQGITEWNNLTVEDLLGMDNLEALVDPRKAMEEITEEGILYVVMPEQVMSVSREEIPLADLPSAAAGTNGLADWVNPFPIQGLQGLSQWNLNAFTYDNDVSNVGMQELYGIMYALDSFQHAGQQSEDTGEKTQEAVEGITEQNVLEYEIEYLIAGHGSDYENMTEIAERLAAMRFVPNAIYAFSDETMKEGALVFATLILAPEGLAAAAEPVSYVLLACWAYGESLLDVKALLQGETVPVMKDKNTWQLSLNGIQNIATEAGNGCEIEQGLDYEAYLMLMLASMPDSELKYYRMLDIMQLNIQADIPGFKLENCVYEFQLQSEITEGKYVWYMEDCGSYLLEE